MQDSKAFIIVAKPGTIFNLQDCGIPLDITSHKPVDLSLTSTEKERESSLQLRHALHVGALIKVVDPETVKLPPAPEPTFTIPELKPVLGDGTLSSRTSIKKIEGKNTPDSYVIETSIPESIQEAIANGIAKNKADDFAEQQRILAVNSEEEEADIDAVIKSGKKAIPVLPNGTVDGQPAGYEFKAPISPGLEAANAGMGLEGAGEEESEEEGASSEETAETDAPKKKIPKAKKAKNSKKKKPQE